mmetsp:Transcript_7197/g.11473  ORF Transcript_7197/g.11473 Transcript_7197/m.11473 type:complete len:80 (-) Transcript_7197:1168-1407(-)
MTNLGASTQYQPQAFHNHASAQIRLFNEFLSDLAHIYTVSSLCVFSQAPPCLFQVGASLGSGICIHTSFHNKIKSKHRY